MNKISANANKVRGIYISKFIMIIQMAHSDLTYHKIFMVGGLGPIRDSP